MTSKVDRLVCAVPIALFTCLIANLGNAQSVETEEVDSGNFDEALDELSIDVAHSIGDAVGQLGLSINGDLRIGHILAGDGFDDIVLRNPDAIRARWRIRSTWGITERLRGVVRIAGSLFDQRLSAGFVLQPYIPTGDQHKGRPDHDR